MSSGFGGVLQNMATQNCFRNSRFATIRLLLFMRFCSFESVHKKAEKFALYIEYHQFEKLHPRQPIVHHDDSLQRQMQTCYI